jgi:xylose isomerase
MDAFARGLKAAAKMIRDKRLSKFVQRRYAGWDTAFGRAIEKGRMNFTRLEKHALANREPKVQSGRQEMLENIINEYI